VRLPIGRFLGKKKDAPEASPAPTAAPVGDTPATPSVASKQAATASPPDLKSQATATEPGPAKPLPEQMPKRPADAARYQTPAQALAKRPPSASSPAEENAMARKAKDASKTPAKEAPKSTARDLGKGAAHDDPTPPAAAARADQATTLNPVTVTPKEPPMAIDISKLQDITGFIGAAVVDADSGMMLASIGGGALLDMEVAGAANTEVVKAKLRAMEALGLDDAIEDILITLGKQYHLIRPLAKQPTTFIYVAVDRKTANLALARSQTKAVESTLKI